jgi:hypothetical protein
MGTLLVGWSEIERITRKKTQDAFSLCARKGIPRRTAGRVMLFQVHSLSTLG